jgi:cytochrome c oxidase subunit 3
MGLMALLATVTMLFVAFTAALMVRRSSADWAPVALPGILWANTAVLLLSSSALEGARAAVRRGRADRAGRLLDIAALLGLLFLAGQILAWTRLVRQGVLLPGRPHAAFFYMLSAVHAAHLLGGLAALAWTRRRLSRGVYVRRAAGLTHAAIYWHFVGGVWLYVFGLLLLF